jgi:hypothetical protein
MTLALIKFPLSLLDLSENTPSDRYVYDDLVAYHRLALDIPHPKGVVLDDRLRIRSGEIFARVARDLGRDSVVIQMAEEPPLRLLELPGVEVRYVDSSDLSSDQKAGAREWHMMFFFQIPTRKNLRSISGHLAGAFGVPRETLFEPEWRYQEMVHPGNWVGLLAPVPDDGYEASKRIIHALREIDQVVPIRSYQGRAFEKFRSPAGG